MAQDTTGTSSGGTSVGGTSSGDTSSGGTSASSEASSTTGVALPEACSAYADAISQCYDQAAGMAAGQYCAEAFASYQMAYGAECIAVFEDWLACLSSLTCEMLMTEKVCVEQNMALEMTCSPMGT